MKLVLLYIMSALYILTGANHFFSTSQYIFHVPDWLPARQMFIYGTGCLEILYGSLLIHFTTRRLGALLIISLLIAQFPVDISRVMYGCRQETFSPWLPVLGLLSHLLLIGWAYVYTTGNNCQKRLEKGVIRWIGQAG